MKGPKARKGRRLGAQQVWGLRLQVSEATVNIRPTERQEVEVLDLHLCRVLFILGG